MLLIGIAASSSFQTNRDVTLKPGQSTVVDGRKITYVRPDRRGRQREVHLRRPCSGSKKAASWSAILHPSRRYFRPTGQPAGTIGSYFDGEATSEVGLDAGFRNDLWIAVAAGHHRRAAPGAGGRQGLPRLRQRRPGHAAAVQSAGGD